MLPSVSQRFCTPRRGHVQRVHKHPSDQRWGSALVQSREAFEAHSLHQTVDGAFELRRIAGLEADLDCVEGVADCSR